jgi:hypothetical protein
MPVREASTYAGVFIEVIMVVASSTRLRLCFFVFDG